MHSVLSAAREIRRFSAVACLSLLPLLAHAADVYSQPYEETANGAYYASTLAGFVQYDSFVVSADSSIQKVTWWGADLNELLAGANTLNPDSFTVAIFADTGEGAPGVQLSSSTIINSGNATVVGSVLGLSLYEYSGRLDNAFNAVAGTTYWIEIADATTNGDWFWATGSGPDDSHITNQGTSSVTADDLAFSLQGTTAAVPEPSGAALLLLGGVGMLCARKRLQRGRVD